MEYSPPALSSYRHARLVECGIDTQATRIAYLVLCFDCVMLVSYHADCARNLLRHVVVE